MDVVVLALGLVLVVLSSLALSACLRLRSFAGFGLAAYLIAWTTVISTTYLLSIGASLDRASLLGGLFVVAVAASALWAQQQRPVPPFRTWLLAARDLARDRALLALGVAASLAYGYVAVIAVGTAPNDGDPLVYELTRAAFWRQQHGVGAINAAYDNRLDQSPPHAEIGQLATMLLSHSDRFVALGQFTAVFAVTLGVAGIGRRIGLVPRQAAFGALLVPFFPVVLVQSWTGFTDIVFAAFLVAACYFALGAAQVELVPFGLAVGLALGTKFLGPLLLPIVAVMVLVAQPARRLGWFALAGLTGGAFGGMWYVANGLRAKEALGGVDKTGFQELAPSVVLGSLNRYVVELLDLSGAIGSDAVVFVLVGMVLAWIAAVVLVVKPPAPWWLAISTLIAGLVPFAVIGMDRTLAWLSARVWDANGSVELADLLVLVFVGIVLAWVAVVARMAKRQAPWWLVLSALVVGLVPFAIIRMHWALAWWSARAWDANGSTELARWFRAQPVQIDSDGALSWFGPIGAAIVATAAPLTVILFRRGTFRRPALVAGFAPVVVLAIVATTIVYLPYQGRYFISGIALGAAAWGAIARWRAMRYGIASIAIVMAVLCLVNARGKPSGLELLRNDAPPGVWGMPRWEQQGLLRPTAPERDEINTLRFVETYVPLDASIGVALQGNSFGFPYFGPRLTRHVVVVDKGDTVPDSIGWLVTAPGTTPLGCPAAWRAARRGPFGWGVWQRTGLGSRCTTRTELSDGDGA